MFDVFVNYRTLDARFGAAEVHRFLVERFGGGRVFLDHVSMTAGAVYPAEIRAALEQTRVLVVLIGPDWLACEADTGIRLVDREGDWVRREIRRSLERGIEIVPVLLDGVGLPADLPADIDRLLLRQTATVAHRSLGADLERLADHLVDLIPELALPDLFEETPELSDDPLPSELLRAEYRVVEFLPVDDALARLIGWLAGRERVDVRLLTGPGGRGKSRLAAELVAHAHTLGIHAGFVRADATSGVIARVGAVRGDVLLVIDYAETRPEQVVEVLTAVMARPADRGAAHVLLLARSTGPWLRILERHRDSRIAEIAADLVTETVARVERGTRRLEQFTRATAAFRARLRVDEHTPLPPDLDEDRYDQVLDLHAAALAAVLDAKLAARTGAVSEPRSDPVRRILHHEERYWALSAPAHPSGTDPERLREVVATATLTGANTQASGRAVLTALRSLDNTGRGVVADHLSWLGRIYPGQATMNPLRPDRLGEDLVADVLTDYPELADDLAPVLDDEQLFRALTVLARAARRHAVSEAMTALLATDPAARIGIAITVATQVDDPTLPQVLGALRGGEDLTAAIVDSLPDRSLALAAFAVTHTKALLRAETRREPVDAEFVAALRHNLALRYSEIGEHDKALVSAGEAVRDYRALAGEDPITVIDLADALAALASKYAALGLNAEGVPVAEEAVALLDGLGDPPAAWSEHARASADALIVLADLLDEDGDSGAALAAIERAVAILRPVAEETGDVDQRHALASALETLGTVHSARAEFREALEANAESVRWYRELDAEQPDRFRDSLIRMLGNLAGNHAELRRWEEGAAFGAEAVELARSLVARYGDVHLVQLADTLNNTAALLRRLDDHDTALTYLEEAVPLYRALSNRVPGVYLSALAGALHNLGNCLHERGDAARAVDAYEESVEIYRKLSEPGREETQESLAEALVGLAHARSESDDEQGAFELTREAVDLLERLVGRDRATTRRKLTHALHMASAAAFDLGLIEQACRDAEYAADLFPRVLDENPSDRGLRAEYVSVLHGFARALDADEQHERAAEIFTRTIELGRADIERDELAGVLVNAGVCAGSRGDHDAALAFATEAVGIHRVLRDEKADNRADFAEALNNLADTHCDRGEWDLARGRADEAVALAMELREEDATDADSLAVYALITRARAAGPGDSAGAGIYLRTARTIGGDDPELRDLVSEWAARLKVRKRDMR